MKHVNRRHYFAKEAQIDGEVTFEWIDTKGNLADALTKALTGQMRKLRKLTVLGGKALSAMCARHWRARPETMRSGTERRGVMYRVVATALGERRPTKPHRCRPV